MCLVSAVCSHAHYSYSSHTYNHPCAWYLLCARTLTTTTRPIPITIHVLARTLSATCARTLTTATRPIPITIHVLGICCVLARSLSMCLVSAVSSLAHTYTHPCAWYLLCARTLTTATHPIPITIHVLGICCVLARSLQLLVPYL